LPATPLEPFEPEAPLAPAFGLADRDADPLRDFGLDFDFDFELEDRLFCFVFVCAMNPFLLVGDEAVLAPSVPANWRFKLRIRFCTGVRGPVDANLLDRAGARVTFAGESGPAMIGDASWDLVLLVEYPTRRAFLDMVGSPEYNEIAHLRSEALELGELHPLEAAELP
jgi:hypothetical protein